MTTLPLEATKSPLGDNISFRIYQDGSVVHQDNFKYHDLGIIEELPYHTVSVPYVIVEHITNEAQGY